MHSIMHAAKGEKYKIRFETLKDCTNFKIYKSKLAMVGEDILKSKGDIVAHFNNNDEIVIQSTNVMRLDNRGVFNNLKAFELDLRNVDTSKVTSLKSMFWYTDIDKIDFSNFNTSEVMDMSMAFYSLRTKELDISKFDLSKTIDATGMFEYADIKRLNMSNFDTSKLRDITGMFKGATVGEIIAKGIFDERLISQIKQLEIFRTRIIWD